MSTPTKPAVFTPVEVTNEATLESLNTSVSTVLAVVDGAPTLLWQTEDGGWCGTRAVAEDDGPWEQVPDASKQTLAVQASLDLSDPEVLPVTILWADSTFEVFDACENCGTSTDLADVTFNQMTLCTTCLDLFRAEMTAEDVIVINPSALLSPAERAELADGLDELARNRSLTAGRAGDLPLGSA